jgi:UDP-glucose 4-epimerase
MTRILITGGCGFIGVNLINYLRKTMPRSDVVILDNLVLGKKEYLNEYGVEFVEGDIRDRTLVTDLVRGIDAVIHLAADTSVLESIENPDFNFDVNVNGTYNLLRAARLGGVERFICASTGGAIIGEATPPVHEGMVPRPLSPYGASKLMAEGYMSAFFGSYGMQTVALRFSNVYGPRSYLKGSIVSLIYKKILKNETLTIYGDGSQTRDYVYVDDICDAIVRSMQVQGGGHVFQLGTGQGTSLNDLVSRIQSIIGADYNLQVEYRDFRPGEVKFNFTDISHAKKILGYQPKISLPEGLASTWDWFLRNEAV